MNITFFSFLMALFFSMLFILAVHFLRNCEAFLKGFGVPTVLLLYALCIGRIMLPIEFSFTVPVRAQNVYNQFYRAVSQPVRDSQVSPLEIAGWIWLLGAVWCLARFLKKYFVSAYRLRRFECQRNTVAEEVLETIKQETGKHFQIHLFVYPKTEIPMGVGMFHRSILLPGREWTREELYYILLHEYTHFLNHDQAVKFLLNIFRCVLWWNPLAYLLEADVADMLEIKCDLTVIQGFQDREKAAYLHVLLEALKKAERKPRFLGILPVTTQLFKRKNRSAMMERFDMVMYQPKKQTVAAVQAVFCGLCILLVLVSYTFVLQPFYEAPQEEINVVQDLSGYILKHENDEYFFVQENGTVREMSKENIDMLIEAGFEIKEE